MSDKAEILRMAGKVRVLSSPSEPLDDLTIHCCDLNIFLIDFIDGLGLTYSEDPIGFPWIEEFTILHPSPSNP